MHTHTHTLAAYLFSLLELAKWGNSWSYDGGLSSLSSAAGAAPLDPCEWCVEPVADVYVSPPPPPPPLELNAVDRVLLRRLSTECPWVSCSGKKQSLMCQHSQRHEPTPTNVNISDVNALITMSVLFAVASLATTIGGLGHTHHPHPNRMVAGNYWYRHFSVSPIYTCFRSNWLNSADHNLNKWKWDIHSG